MSATPSTDIRYYLAWTDDYEVTLVVPWDGQQREEEVRIVADRNPEVIYFGVEPPPPPYEVTEVTLSKGEPYWRVVERATGKVVAQHETESLIRKVADALNEGRK